MITKKEFKSSIEGYEAVCNHNMQAGWDVFGTLFGDKYSIFVYAGDNLNNISFSELDDKAYEIYIKEI